MRAARARKRARFAVLSGWGRRECREVVRWLREWRRRERRVAVWVRLAKMMVDFLELRGVRRSVWR